MALGSFVSGSYVGTWVENGGDPLTPNDCGITDDGFTVGVTHAAEKIEQSDIFGAQLIELIHRGFSGVTLEFTCLEWLVSTLLMAFPYNPPTVTGATYLGPGPIGARASDNVGSLVLTADALTPAAAAPASVAAPFPIIAPDFKVAWTYTSKLRRTPLQLQILPFEDPNDADIVKYLSFT